MTEYEGDHWFKLLLLFSKFICLYFIYFFVQNISVTKVKASSLKTVKDPHGLLPHVRSRP